MRRVVRVAILGFTLLMASSLSATTTLARHRPTPTPLPTVTPAPTPTATSGYNGAAAAQYADVYWSSYNPGYPSFANQGGDCTNFVSQAPFSGGLAMRTSPPYSGSAAWYMLKSGGSWAWSTSWINSQGNSAFLRGGPSGVTQVASYFAPAPGQIVASNALSGDVVFYDWNNDGIYDHEAIISTPDGQSIDAHTNNRYHAYWTLAQYNSQWATTRITVFHIPGGTK